MKKTLIITEKNDILRDIKSAIGGNFSFVGEKSFGYYENEDYRIVSCFGHMLELKHPEDYDKEKYKFWNVENLPIYFSPWETSYKKKKVATSKKSKNGGKIYERKLDTDVKKKLDLIAKLLKETDSVIHAGDNDDEGQLLIDEILDFYKFKGDVKRIIINDNNDDKIRKALANLEPNEKHRPRGYAAQARSVADIIVGINLSQIYTLKLGSLHSVGRVQTPTLGLIVERDLTIENHKKIKYYELSILVQNGDYSVGLKYIPDKNDPDLTDGRFLSKEPLKKIFNQINGKDITVNVNEKNRKENPPLPWNLVKLQAESSKQFSYSAKETTKITQDLRVKYKSVTYNRTDSQYLPEEFHKEAPTVLSKAINFFYNGNIPNLDFNKKSSAFNTSKTTAHHGIVPAGNPDISKFSEKEKNVYKLIADNYIYQFMPPAEYNERIISGQIDGLNFASTKRNLITEGYLSLKGYKQEESEEKDHFFSFESGLSKIIASDIAEKETKPLARYTEETLLLDMTRISKFVKDENLKNALLSKDADKPDENGSIGTSSTRAGIIDILLDPSRDFVKKKGKQFISTEKGRKFINDLPKMLSTPELTAKWWIIQEQIIEGKVPKEALIENVRDMVFSVVEEEIKNIEP
ncbi:MAG: hypothetical protein LBD41_00055, partial [Clostridiales Family XIII bacterium]|nr:hypothetical protein [Clostridiales Family XIII bacterium]